MSDQHPPSPAEAPPSEDFEDLSDDDEEEENVFAEPLTPVTLRPSSIALLRDLKKRCSTHIDMLRAEWLGNQAYKSHPRIPDATSVVRDAGLLLQMPSAPARQVITLAKEGTDAKSNKLKNEKVKTLVKKMKAKSARIEDYITNVEFLWATMTSTRNLHRNTRCASARTWGC
jgi:hypothetical protein